MDRLRLTIGTTLSGRTVYEVLSDTLMLSSSRIKRVKLLDDGILLNGTRVFTTAAVREGDTLDVFIGDTEQSPLAPVPMPLDIVYEDDALLVINKPAGLAVHPTQDPDEVSLENGLRAYLGDRITAHPVSRLDRGTTGLMTVAKSGFVHEMFRRVMHTDDFRREYRGICHGVPEPAHGFIDGPIGFAEGSRYQRTVRPDGMPSRTEYETLSTDGCYTLLRLVPYTGRTHQLRVHLSHAGHPLVGDWLYGTEERDIITRPALHSYELWMTHPLTGEKLHLTAPLPEDMQRLLNKDR